MQAMLLERVGPVAAGTAPLRLAEVPAPQPRAGEVLLEVAACGVCHTELDEIEGRTPPPRLPVIVGHQVVGRVVDLGPGAGPWEVGQRAGLAWIYSACGTCEFCRTDRENLCPQFRATGRDHDGGYAEFVTAPAAFCVPIPEPLTDAEAAPLLCAGAIGYRSLRLAQVSPGQRLGLTGFGASAQLVLGLVQAVSPGAEVFVFARNPRERELALARGAAWAGETTALAPVRLHAILDTTPAWLPVVEAMKNLLPGGRLVINAIRKEEADKAALVQLDYARDLWMEKEIKSVANVTRRNVAELLALADQCHLRPSVDLYPLAEANRALVELKAGPVTAAKVLVMGPR